MTDYKERVNKVCEGLFRKGKNITWRYETNPFYSEASLLVLFYDLNTQVRIPLPSPICPDSFLEGHVRHQMKEAIAGFYLNPKESDT